MSILWVNLGLILLVVGSDFLVKASVGLSLKFNISKLGNKDDGGFHFATSAPKIIGGV